MVQKWSVLKKRRLSNPSLDEGSGSDFCVKDKTVKLNCADDFVSSNILCHDICASDLPTCQYTESQKIPCSSLLREEEKWKRRVDALDTAINIYVQKGKF